MTDLLVRPSLGAVHSSAPTPLSACSLRGNGNRVACVVGDRLVTHLQLADLIEARRLELGVTPRLVVLHGANSLEFVVTYLAALDGRHPIIVAATARSAAELAHRFGAAIRVDASRDDHVEIERSQHPGTTRWHRDLAVLMSTSGSTGSPKLVRLSLEAVTGNALAIAASLDLRSDDRAITSLPLHYCYGLSVVTSHLSVGGAVVLTDASVVDPCFWSAVRDHRVTTLSGVPHTFEMIERMNADVLASPSLRRVTQAGGRMDADDIQRLAGRGVRSGWDLVVMYGQTEATARMAYLPPAGAFTAPASVGVAIPGGHIRLDPVTQAGPGVGEVVYVGSNVMMGYASSDSDLSRGFDLRELRTGDLGRFDDAGNLEIVGRLNRFVKVHGKRIDLDHLVDDLQIALGSQTRFHVTGDDDGIVIATLDPNASQTSLDAELTDRVARRLEIPRGRVLALRLATLPRTGSGKVDGPALIESARRVVAEAHADSAIDRDATIVDAFAVVFGRRPSPDSTFVSLGGDSFSYVEMSIRLESVLGSLPPDWHLRSLSDLETLRERRPAPTRWQRWSRSVDTSVAIRAIGILLIVCTHMRIFRVAGGAHALLAVAGFNVARFQLQANELPGRSKRAIVSVTRIAVPTTVWIGLNMALVGGYSVGAMFLVNNYTGSADRTDGRWEYWYFEAFVQVMVVLVVAFSFAPVRRAERARPFAFALAVLAVMSLFRFELLNLGGAYNEIFRTHAVAFFVALGWCAQRASTTAQRLLVTVLATVTTLGYFETVDRVDQLDRELRILAAVLALVWIRSVRLPTPVAVVVGKVAAASMWIFLVHWQVWPIFTSWLDDRAAYVATIGVGVGVWWVVAKVTATVAQLRQRRMVGRRTSSQVSSADTVIKSNDATPVSA